MRDRPEVSTTLADPANLRVLLAVQLRPELVVRRYWPDKNDIATYFAVQVWRTIQPWDLSDEVVTISAYTLGELLMAAETPEECVQALDTTLLELAQAAEKNCLN